MENICCDLGQENQQAYKDWVMSFISFVYQWIPYNTWCLWYIFIEEKHSKNKRSKCLWHSGMQLPIEIYLEHENMCLLARWGCIFLSKVISFGVGGYKIVHFRAFNNICSDPQEIEEECFHLITQKGIWSLILPSGSSQQSPSVGCRGRGSQNTHQQWTEEPCPSLQFQIRTF